MPNSSCSNKLPHSIALVVNDSVAVANADALVRNPQRVNGVSEVGRQGVVNGIRVLVRAFKEIHTHGRRILAVSNGIARGFIERVAIVCVTQASVAHPRLHSHPRALPNQQSTHCAKYVSVRV